MHVLTIVDKVKENKSAATLMGSGRGVRLVWGDYISGGYMLAGLVCTYVGFGLNTGDDLVKPASVWMPVKACQLKIIILLCFQQLQTHLIQNNMTRIKRSVLYDMYDNTMLKPKY